MLVHFGYLNTKFIGMVSHIYSIRLQETCINSLMCYMCEEGVLYRITKAKQFLETKHTSNEMHHKQRLSNLGNFYYKKGDP